MMTFSPSSEDVQKRLTEFITRVSGLEAHIEQAAPLAGGASRDMWLLVVKLDGAPQRLVLRRDLPTVMHEQALTRAQEFKVMEVAQAHRVRVAQPRWLCQDSDVLGSPFFLMDYVEGIAIGRKVVQIPQIGKLLPGQMAEQLARIHAIDPDSLDFLPRPRPDCSPAQEAIAQTYAMLDRLDLHHPAFEFALRWAEQHAPTPDQVTFIHGDFRIGNLIVNEHGLAAVSDWEFAHLGDPDEELGYLCLRDWRFGNYHLEMGGISERESFLQAYEHASLRRVRRTSVDFWEFMGNLRWGVICLSQANRHLSGSDPSVEFASLGRRSAEMQLEMLRLIDKMGR